MKKYLSLVKFSHTIFALPFAMVGFLYGLICSHSVFSAQLLFMVIGCMVTARNAAMAFNRYLDRDIDALNPRTSSREIPSGIISSKNAVAFIIINCLLFCSFTYFINGLCFALSPVALLITLGYSYTKRFTWLCHFVLGLGLSLAPVGAFMAVTNSFQSNLYYLAGAILLWVAGFDIIYALQDEEFDKSVKLQSVPSLLGLKKAILISLTLHIICIVLLYLFTQSVIWSVDGFGIIYWIGYALFVIFVLYQHYLVNRNGLSIINASFFLTNGFGSLIYGTCFILDYLI